MQRSLVKETTYNESSLRPFENYKTMSSTHRRVVHFSGLRFSVIIVERQVEFSTETGDATVT